MKLWSGIFAIITIAGSGMCFQPASAQTFTGHEYTADDSNIANPERGFYHHTETNSGFYSSLDAGTLKSYRAEGIVMILRVFYLADFLNGPIAESYLKSVQQDFNAARTAGVKVIVRFAYTRKSSPPYGDATPERVLQHIAQLKPYLQKNVDVIAVVQAGLIGAWGEWYYTDHFSQTLGNPTAADWVNRRAVVNALLDAVPASRAVQVRTPAYKFSIVESEEPLNDETAYSGAPASRIGHHNDCFLASADDYGTYTSNMTEEKAYLEQETHYLPMGGETCGESVPLSECPNALAQMERFHWSYLNRDYHSGVLSGWQSGSCMPDVFNKLGYRFRLIESTLQNAAKPGGSFQFSIKLVNDGWASPYNARLVEVLARNQTTGQIFRLSIDEDPRKWFSAETVTLDLSAGLPPGIPVGEYDVLLNLPDPTITLRNNPDYSIRLANLETWEAASGYNNLNHTLTIANTPSLPDYSGTDLFLPVQETIDRPIVKNDGNVSEWSDVWPVLSGGDYQLKVYNDADSLYIVKEGQPGDSYEIYIDADRDGLAGSTISPWITSMADYKLTNEGLFVWEGSSWSSAFPVVVHEADGQTEISFHRDLFTTIVPDLELGISLHVNNVEDTYLPFAGNKFASYRLLLPEPLVMEQTSSGSKVILYWGDQYENYYRVIERAMGSGAYEQIGVVDSRDFHFIDWIESETEIKYRSYHISTDGSSISVYGDDVSAALSERPPYYDFVADGNIGEWEGIIPIQTSVYDGQTVAYKLHMSANAVNVFFQGTTTEHYAFYFDSDHSATTGGEDPWGYSGYDFLVEDGSLYDLRTGAAVLRTTVEHQQAGNYLEIAMPLSLFDNLGNNTVIYTAAQVTIDGTSINFVGSDDEPLEYLRTLPSIVPLSVTVDPSNDSPESKLVIQWAPCSGCEGYVIERSIGNAEDFATAGTVGKTTFAYYDEGLTEGMVYYYRVYSYNEAGLSLPSAVVSGSPGAVVSIEGLEEKVLSIYPNPAEGVLYVQNDHSLSYRAYQIINTAGQPVQSGTLDNFNRLEVISISVQQLLSGIYVLKFSGDRTAMMRFVKK